MFLMFFFIGLKASFSYSMEPFFYPYFFFVKNQQHQQNIALLINNYVKKVNTAFLSTLCWRTLNLLYSWPTINIRPHIMHFICIHYSYYMHAKHGLTPSNLSYYMHGWVIKRSNEPFIQHRCFSEAWADSIKGNIDDVTILTKNKLEIFQISIFK